MNEWMNEAIARRGPCKVPSLLNKARRQGGWFIFRYLWALAIIQQQHRHQQHQQHHNVTETDPPVPLHTGLISCFYLCVSWSCLHQIREAADFSSLNFFTGTTNNNHVIMKTCIQNHHWRSKAQRMITIYSRLVSDRYGQTVALRFLGGSGILHVLGNSSESSTVEI